MSAFNQPSGMRLCNQRHARDHECVTFTSPSGEVEIGELSNLSIQGARILTVGHHSTGTIVQIHVPATRHAEAKFCLRR